MECTIFIQMLLAQLVMLKVKLKAALNPNRSFVTFSSFLFHMHGHY